MPWIGQEDNSDRLTDRLASPCGLETRKKKKKKPQSAQTAQTSFLNQQKRKCSSISLHHPSHDPLNSQPASLDVLVSTSWASWSVPDVAPRFGNREGGLGGGKYLLQLINSRGDWLRVFHDVPSQAENHGNGKGSITNPESGRRDASFLKLLPKAVSASTRQSLPTGSVRTFFYTGKIPCSEGRKVR